MKSLLFKSLALLLLISPLAQAETIRIATEGAYPPFNFMDKNNIPQGFDVDIARALCVEMRADCVIVTQDWDGIIPALLLRKYDAIIASMSITPERAKRVDFSDYYYTNGLRYVAAKGSDFGPANLKGKTIGAQRSTIAGQYLEDNVADMASVKLYDTQENLYLDAAAGRVDGFLSDVLPAYDWLQTTEGQGYEFKGDTFAKDDKIGIATRKGSDLIPKFNAALKAIIDNGTYAKINAKYFPFSIY